MTSCLQFLRLQTTRMCMKEYYSSRLFVKKRSLLDCTAYCSLNLSSQDKKLEQNPELVYVGSLATQIRGVKMFSLITSVTGLCFQPILYEQASRLNSKPLIVAVCGVVGFFTFVTPILLNLVTKKYVTEIWYDEKADKYKATTITLFLREKDIEFTPDDVEIPDIPGMFTSLTIKGVPLFIEPTTFMNSMHYGRIMGYDKPLDFKLGESSENKIKK